MKANITGTIVRNRMTHDEKWETVDKIDLDLDVDVPEIFTEASMRLDRLVAGLIEAAQRIAESRQDGT